jgi:F-type H+-transporting ATPase subunit b
MNSRRLGIGLRVWPIVLVLGMIGAALPGGHQSVVLAQESVSPATAETHPVAKVKESEADETAQFKQSPAVQFIAKVTGLSVKNAYWLCVVANFAVVAGALFWALKKYLPSMFRSRTASIQKAMEEARAASEDANRRLAEIEARLARLDGEIGEMRGAAEMEAVREEERIKAGTADDLRKVVESAEQEIAAAGKAARRELRAYAADLVVSLAEKQIQVDAKTDQGLVRGFAQHLVSDDVRKDGR